MQNPAEGMGRVGKTCKTGRKCAIPGTKLSAGKTLTPILPSSAPAGAAALFQQVPGTALARAVALGLLPGFLSLHRAKLLFLCLALVWDGEGEWGIAVRKGGTPLVALQHEAPSLTHRRGEGRDGVSAGFYRPADQQEWTL